MPDDLARIIQSQIDAWIAELEVLGRDPRVRKFAELRQKLDDADARYPLGSPSNGVGARPNPLGIPANELSAFKADDLEDLVVRTPQAGPAERWPRL